MTAPGDVDDEVLRKLRRSGPPFFFGGWGREVVGLILGGTTGWDEVAELVTESYCMLAPDKLARLVVRPAG